MPWEDLDEHLEEVFGGPQILSKEEYARFGGWARLTSLGEDTTRATTGARPGPKPKPRPVVQARPAYIICKACGTVADVLPTGPVGEFCSYKCREGKQPWQRR